MDFLQKNKFLRKAMYKIGVGRGKKLVSSFEKFCNKGERILDIGCGTCNITEILSNKGFNISPLDIRDVSVVDGINPLIYDGERVPFKDNEFDKSIILTVLHHTPNPVEILKEAKRVSQEIIIIEDVYSNWFGKYWTYFFDSLFNLEFFGHPHSNKSDREWKEVFNDLGLKLVDTQYFRTFLVFKLATYYLVKS